jgi:hypothetical protein
VVVLVVDTTFIKTQVVVAQVEAQVVTMASQGLLLLQVKATLEAQDTATMRVQVVEAVQVQ